MDKATFKALLRTHGRHARVKGLRQMHPVAIVSDYRAAIVKGPLAYAHALVKRYVIPALPHLEGKATNRITRDARDPLHLFYVVGEGANAESNGSVGVGHKTQELAEKAASQRNYQLAQAYQKAKARGGLGEEHSTDPINGRITTRAEAFSKRVEVISGHEAQARGLFKGTQLERVGNGVLTREATATIVTEAPAVEVASVGHALDAARSAFARKYPREKLAQIVQPVATDLARFQAEQLNRQLREAVTVDVVGSEDWLPPVISAFTQENVSLIKSIPADYFSDLEKKLSADLADGVRWEELASTIQERYGVAERRAELIARDQAGKFFGDLNRVRQVDLGIVGAIWRGMLDNRERDEHIAREGQSFDWETGIDGETPGQPVLCRCNGEPDLQRLINED